MQFPANISYATKEDSTELVDLLNSAYRGDASRKGWTTEANLLEGELRTDENEIDRLMDKPSAVFLKYTENGCIIGCVNLQKHGDRIYLGMLSVSPLIQSKGIGKQLMLASEIHAKNENCSSIYMTVISVRSELIAWYERVGYKDTGERKPFLVDEKYGVPTQKLEFIVMEKLVG